MATPVDELLKRGSEVIRTVHDSPARMAMADVSSIANILDRFFKRDGNLLDFLKERKDLDVLMLEEITKMATQLEHLSTLPVQILTLEELLIELNNKMGRMLHLQETGTVRIIETSAVNIIAGRRYDLFRGYAEAGSLQSILLNFSSDQVEGNLVLDNGKIEFNFDVIKEMNAFDSSGREWWCSKYDDTNNEYVLQLTPVVPLAFDKQCWVRIWNKSATDITLNTGRFVKHSKPVDLADVKAQVYGRDVQLERSKKLREEMSLKAKQEEIEHAGEVFK